MKQQLITPIRVFLPPRQLVVDGERNSFFEPIALIACESELVPFALEPERHVEIFGDVRLGPEFLVAVFVGVGYLLQGGPAEDGVVADEGADVTAGDGVADRGVDEVCEEGDSGLCGVSFRSHKVWEVGKGRGEDEPQRNHW